jgi:uncharacterized protein YqeY
MGKVKDRITEELKNAMKAREEAKVSTLRMIKTEILKLEANEGGKEVDDAAFLQLLKSMKKQREDSIEEFKKAGRNDLLTKEQKELEILNTYLPSQLSDAEIEALVDAAIAEVGARDVKAMGQVMKAVMAKIEGRADGKRVNPIVKAKLSK